MLCVWSHQQCSAGALTMPASQAIVDFGAVRVSTEALISAILPEVERCRGEVHDLLPQLVRVRHASFVGRVAGAAAQLTARPASPDTFERHLTFLGGFDESRRGLDREMDDVEAHFELCEVLPCCAVIRCAVLRWQAPPPPPPRGVRQVLSRGTPVRGDMDVRLQK